MARSLVIASAVLAGSALNGAYAQNDSWCAYFSGGATKCAFATLEECIKTIQGKTGICNRNAQHVAPGEANSSSSSAASPNPAATGMMAERAHHLRHRGAHHIRGRKIEGGGKRYRVNRHPNRTR